MNELIQLGRQTFELANSGGVRKVGKYMRDADDRIVGLAADYNKGAKEANKAMRKAHNAKMREKFGKEWYNDKDLLKKNYSKMGAMKKAGKHLKRPAIRKRLGYGTLGVALTGVGAAYARKKKD